MTKRIFRSIILVAGAVLLASIVLIMGCLYDYFSSVQNSQLRDELELAAKAVEDSGETYLAKLSSVRYRLTWISEDGAVLFDTQTDASQMENHSDRKEVREALLSGTGSSTRYSSTMLEKMSYQAMLMPDGTVLRISANQATIGVIVLGMLQPMIIVLFVALILSGVLAGRVSKRIVEPLNRLDLDSPLENDTFEELSPLLTRLNLQQRSIETQLERLTKQRDEFAQITNSMKEGLVLLDAKGMIVSMNPTACRLFDARSDCAGKDFLTVERSREVEDAVKAALESGQSELRIERLGYMYQLDISALVSGSETIGAVILAFDVSDREYAERNRREFTANVSHELKTPLQSIMGSAELIENGVVKPEDMPHFIGNIRKEAARLVALIDDIIGLSQLDEGGALEYESTDLRAVADDVASDLVGAAELRGVDISVEGASAEIMTVRKLAHEIIYNLCDNAIKYNKEGGSVKVAISSDAENGVIRVTDTGIGIPEEQQNRVFERFYRVDKSRSKDTGGTGLGLSIVKHAVSDLHGHIELSSRPGAGTDITVTLPKKP